ncbi:MAG: phosphoglucosamine mutase [Acidobacteriota bacterium]
MPERLFGTDGIRGKAGDYPLDEKTVEAMGRSLVKNLTLELGRAPVLIIGRDTRESGPQIENALARGAIRAGARVESAGVITTPGVAFITRRESFDAGVVISASHNPYQDNGIKVFSPSGKKLSDEMERRIEADLSSIDATDAIDFESAHPSSLDTHRSLYIDHLVEGVGRGLSLDGMSVGLDCANGAASRIAPQVFERLGAKVEVICASPDGRNINESCGSLHLEKLQRLVADKKLDLGIAFDGDADRALMVDERGALVDGDHELLILARMRQKQNRLPGNTVVSTVMSNLGLEIALRRHHIEMIRAQVGDRFVLEEMIGRRANLGGEQSGHIIFPDISLAGDGIITAIEMLRAVKDFDQSLSQLASELKKFPQILVNVRVSSKPPIETLPAVASEIQKMEDEMQGRGRLLVRYSGTENLARVMIEGEDQTRIEKQAHHLADLIRRSIG